MKKGEISVFSVVVRCFLKGLFFLIVFGFEGGLIEVEVEWFIEKDSMLCGFGLRILRIEIVLLYVLSVIFY